MRHICSADVLDVWFPPAPIDAVPNETRVWIDETYVDFGGPDQSLPHDGPDAFEVVAAAREHGLFLREVGQMGRSLGAHAFRIAVKDAGTNARMLKILARIL